MGRIFAIPFTATVTNAGGNVDLWEVLPGDDKPVLLRRLVLGQVSEVGDAAEEGLEIQILRMNATVTGGSGGAAGAPECLGEHGVSPGFTCETNNTTVATTSGTTDILDEIAWNNRGSPCEFWWSEDKYAPRVQQGEGLFIRQATTAADDYTFAGTIYVEEL